MNLFEFRSIVRSLLVLTVLLGVNTALAQSITNPISVLKDHITGVAPLTAAQIVTQGNLIQTSIRQVGTNDIALAAALDLVATFDASANKPLFTVGSTTYNGFTRDGAGDELAQALFDLQQGILDYTYKTANLMTYFSLLNNTKFATSTYFPGAVAQPASPSQGYEVQINATHQEEWGMPNLYVTYAARRPTGCYLAPGSIAEVTVPDAFTNLNWFVRVGCHYWDFSAKSNVKRLDRVSVLYQIAGTTTRIANPLGGNIYIEIPYLQTNGIVTVGITNVVRSPLFRNTIVHQTTPAEWLTERTQPGAWADFESDKFMMQVPRKWIYAYTGANTVMTNWDKAMEAVADMLGRPRVQSKTLLYIQPDVLIRGTANEPGYPQVNQDDIYNPNMAETGNKSHYLLNGPQTALWTAFHEMGHGQSFTKFTGETESAVNFLHVAVKNKAFGWTLNNAFSESVADWNNMTLDQTALSWFLPGNFASGLDMSDTEMKYQHRGHAKYVEVVNLFGWNTVSNFWYSQNVDYENGVFISVNSDPTDGRILRMSKAAGADLRPLFHSWGRQPANATTLKASIDAAGLKPSLLIYDRIKHYQSIIPLTQSQFNANYSVAKGVVGEPDKSWYTNMYAGNYRASVGYAAKAELQYILDLYFTNGVPLNDKWTGAASGVWNTSTVNWKTVATATPTNFVDGSPGDGVLFDDTLTANPAITLNSTVTPIGVVFSNNTAAYSISGTGGVAGNGDLNKSGTGTVTLNTTNTFKGAVVVNDGTLELGGVNTYNGDTSLSGSAVVRASRSGALGVGRIFVDGTQTNTCRVELSGGITLANDLAFHSRSTSANLAPHILNISGTNTLSPPTAIELTSGGNVITLQSDSGKLVLAAGVTTAQSAPRYLGLLGAGNGEVQGALAANMALLKAGSGTWTLTGSSSMNGPTVISNGTLFVNGSLTSTANIVTNAGTLAGNGNIAGAVKVSNGASIKAGNAAGLGNLTLGSLTLGTAVGSAQTINVTAGSAIVEVTGGLTNNGLTTLNVTSAGVVANGVYPLLTYTGPTITSGFALGSLATNVLGTLLYNPGAIALSVTNGNAPAGTNSSINYYTETFDGSGIPLNGKTTTTGGGIWSANSIVTNYGVGVLSASAGSAVLPFTLQTNKTYVLSLDFNYSSGTGGWLGLGFSSATSVSAPGANSTGDRFSNASVNGYAWMIAGNSSISGVYQGGRTTNAIAFTSPTLAAGWHTLKIILDTTGNGSSFKANFLVDNTSVTGGQMNINVAVTTIKSVGFTQYGGGLLTGSTVDNFSLTGVIPLTEPPLLSYTPSGGNWFFTWLGTGFKLQSQTNTLSKGLGTNWSDVPGGNASGVGVSGTVADNPAVFYRLISTP